MCGCCKWCLLLLAGWCEGFYGVQVSEAISAYVVMLFSCLFCLLSRGSVYVVPNFDEMHIAFVWLYGVSWFHSQGYGLAVPSARLPRATLLALLADLVWLIRICWVSFTAWLLSRNGYDCIWLTIFLSLLSFRLEVWSQVGITYLCLL